MPRLAGLPHSHSIVSQAHSSPKCILDFFHLIGYYNVIVKASLQAAESVEQQLLAKADPQEIDLVPPVGYQVRFQNPVELRLEVRRVGEEFFFTGEARANVFLMCVRCTREFTSAIGAPVSVIVHRVPSPRAQPAELEPYVEVPLGTVEFDLGPYVREALLLAAPETPHCREDCKGLCAHCGADLNEEPCRCGGREPDPRWEGLKRFKTMET